MLRGRSQRLGRRQFTSAAVTAMATTNAAACAFGSMLACLPPGLELAIAPIAMLRCVLPLSTLWIPKFQLMAPLRSLACVSLRITAPSLAPLITTCRRLLTLVTAYRRLRRSSPLADACHRLLTLANARCHLRRLSPLTNARRRLRCLSPLANACAAHHRS